MTQFLLLFTWDYQQDQVLKTRTSGLLWYILHKET